MASRVLPEPLKRTIYRSSFLSNLIRSHLNLSAPSGLTEVFVASGALKGARLVLDLKSEKYYWLGTYEPEVQEAVKEFVKPGGVVYDVGANIGYFTILFARTVGRGGEVFAFEPLPANVARLRENIRLNGLEQVVRVIPCAVSDVDGEGTFLVHSSPAMGKVLGSSGRDATYEYQIKVGQVSLDSFVYEQGFQAPDLIKMDIEGGEIKAIPGMSELLERKRPLLLLEIHDPEAAYVAWSVLSQQRYRICRLQAGFPQICRLAEMGWKEYVLGYPG
jgi:FkbM family methyltransferase